MNDVLRIIDEKRQIVAEGPLWDDRRRLLYSIDILGKTIRTTDLGSLDHTEVLYPQQIGCIALREKGALLAVMQDGIYEAMPDGSIKPFCVPKNLKGRRFNDGKVGPDGRLYVGTTDADHNGAFYRVDPDGSFTELLANVGCSNGLAWSSDNKTLYYVDSPELTIDAFDFNMDDGTISNRRTVMPIPCETGQADGMTIDAEDKLWLAVWGGRCIYRVDPIERSVLQKITLPAEKVSCCAFAGEDLKTLVITTASMDTEKSAQPHAGKTFAVKTAVPGLPGWRFRG